MSDIFISYASADRDRVKPLVDALQGRGWSVWWDRKIRPGETWPQAVKAKLTAARCVIVLWSRESIRSDYVLAEAELARQQNTLVPALLDRVNIPWEFMRVQAADLVDWGGSLPNAKLEELAAAVTEVLLRAAPLEPAVAEASSQAEAEDLLAIPSRYVAVTGLVCCIVLASLARYYGKHSAETPAIDVHALTNKLDELAYKLIPDGSFWMGCSPGDDFCYPNEQPSHYVTITESFWMGQTDVTYKAYIKVMKLNPSPGKVDDLNLPVANVTWGQAQTYCQTVGARLPTEAEWEYAARGHSTLGRYGALGDIALHAGNSGGKTHDVGQKQPNAYGLYDMLGNVWQWTADSYGIYSSSPVSNPAQPGPGPEMTIRGGSFNDDPLRVRASFRAGRGPDSPDASIGFRCVANHLGADQR